MRRPHAVAEENNWLGEGALTDAEVAEFTEVVEHLRVVLPALLGEQWTDAVFSGDGYVVTESLRSAGGYFRGYRGVRKTAQGYAVMFRRRARIRRLAGHVQSVRGRCERLCRGRHQLDSVGPRLGSVAWMWNGTVGRIVVGCDRTADPRDPCVVLDWLSVAGWGTMSRQLNAVGENQSRGGDVDVWRQSGSRGAR